MNRCIRYQDYTHLNHAWQEEFLIMSLPGDSVLNVPSRNVLLTRSSWKGEQARTTTNDTTRERRLLPLKKAGKKADHSKAGRPANGARRSSRWRSPRPQLRDFTKAIRLTNTAAAVSWPNGKAVIQAERRSEPERSGRGRLLHWRRRKPSQRASRGVPTRKAWGPAPRREPRLHTRGRQMQARVILWLSARS